ncbi:DUF4145 domain-containing protein [Streptomyces sp. NPDC056738]|uniref:DUF4145 domain-containing protein n=1 Tax=Streptomyces sp. NPDC056738 TaxID=3345933 RepID=UPI0036AC0AD1
MTDAQDRVGTKILATCGSCDKTVMATVAGVLVEENGDNGLPTLLQLASCSKCGDALLAMEEDYGDGWDEDPVTVWPQTQQVMSPLIPETLRRQHGETYRCFTAKAYTATVVMVRRTLEGLCREQGAQGRSLMQMLQHLNSSGKIEGRLLEWSQELRMLGNEGAHFTNTSITPEDAADAIVFSEALIDYIYVYSTQFENFKKRRPKKTGES